MRLIKRLKISQLIKKFNQLKKSVHFFWQLIESSNNGILGFKKFQSIAKIHLFFFGS
jgi:hypothetical protein